MTIFIYFSGISGFSEPKLTINFSYLTMLGQIFAMNMGSMGLKCFPDMFVMPQEPVYPHKKSYGYINGSYIYNIILYL